MKIVPPTKKVSVNIHEFVLRIHFSSEFALSYIYRKNAASAQTAFL